MTPSVYFLASLALVLPFSTLATAGESYWQSGGNDSWSVLQNWRDGKAPGKGDSVVFGGGPGVPAGVPAGQNLEVGAIVATAERTSPAVIQSTPGATGISTLGLYGVPEQAGGKTETLLIANRSKQPLSIVNRDADSAINLQLGASGIIDAEGDITIGAAINGEHGITKRGKGLLVLGDRLTVPKDAVGRTGNTFKGGFTLEDGEVVGYHNSHHENGTLLASPFGLGTIRIKGGAIKNKSYRPQIYQNSVEIEGTATFSKGGPIRFGNRTGGTTTIKGDATIVVTNEAVVFEQKVHGNGRVTKEGKELMVVAGEMTVKELIVKNGGLRVEGTLNCERLEITGSGALSGTGKIHCPNLINPTGANESEFSFKHHGNEIPVLVYQPDHYKQGAPAIVLFHGSTRNATSYRKTGSDIANKLGMLLVVPEFDRMRFTPDAYQEGGIMKGEQLNPPDQWTYTYIEPLLKALYEREGWQMPVYFVGHSAGAQFVNRMAAFQPGHSERIICVNPGTLLFPTRDLKYPFGFGGLPEALSNDEAIKQYLAVPMTLFLGTGDTITEGIPGGEYGKKQGATRIERGRNCYAMAKKLAESKGWPLAWTIVEVEGQGHSSKGMWKSPNAEEAFKKATR